MNKEEIAEYLKGYQQKPIINHKMPWFKEREQVGFKNGVIHQTCRICGTTFRANKTQRCPQCEKDRKAEPRPAYKFEAEEKVTRVKPEQAYDYNLMRRPKERHFNYIEFITAERAVQNPLQVKGATHPRALEPTTTIDYKPYNPEPIVKLNITKPRMHALVTTDTPIEELRRIGRNRPRRKYKAVTFPTKKPTYNNFNHWKAWLVARNNAHATQPLEKHGNMDWEQKYKHAMINRTASKTEWETREAAYFTEHRLAFTRNIDTIEEHKPDNRYPVEAIAGLEVIGDKKTVNAQRKQVMDYFRTNKHGEIITINKDGNLKYPRVHRNHDIINIRDTLHNIEEVIADWKDKTVTSETVEDGEIVWKIKRTYTNNAKHETELIEGLDYTEELVMKKTVPRTPVDPIHRTKMVKTIYKNKANYTSLVVKPARRLVKEVTVEEEEYKAVKWGDRKATHKDTYGAHTPKVRQFTVVWDLVPGRKLKRIKRQG